jgi:chromosome segregation protein
MPNRLKSLGIQGYKTFASRYDFEFAGSITAVVGPNGSGKSNIVDGIRWVLGEQSYSLLRGKRTEDMIFSGSEQRTRAGMAEVTVTFDNSDGWLPIDFTEVAIARRAYRDGQNEYLINDQKVRLKDVSELLAQSGLAERTYTIIGQGLVDAALSLRAEERRRLFEEAAGIGLYRTRREEAFRRLDTTRRNLDRVQDILAELQPRLRSLERQARRAGEYEQVQADLRLILREWYGYYWHHSQNELVRARELADGQEKRLEEVRRKVDSRVLDLTNIRDQVQALRSRLNSWHRQLAALHNLRDELGRDLAVAAERTRSLQEQIQTNQVEQVRMEEELLILETRLESIKADYQHNLAELEQTEIQYNQAIEALRLRQGEREALEQTLSQTRQAQTEYINRTSQLQVRSSERSARIEKLQTEFAEASTALEQARSSIAHAEAQFAQIKELQNQRAQERSQAEQNWQHYQQELKEAEAALRQRFDELSKLKSEAARLSTQLNVLNQAEQALVGYSEGTRLLLEAARSNQLIGTDGALSTRLEVPAEFETAIAGALGEFVDAVLLSSQADSEAALDYALQKGVPSALLPFQQVKTPEPLQISLQDGILGIAVDLIKAPAALQPAVDLLLGHVIVVRDRLAARRALAGMEQTVCAVTLRGEIFYASGLISLATPGGKNEPASSLGRTRQRRELQAILEQNKNQQADLEATYQQKESELDNLRSAGIERESTLETARKAEREVQAEFERGRLAVERSIEQASWHTQRVERISQEIEENERSIIDYQQNISQMESNLQQVADELRRLQNDLAGLPEDEFLDQVNYWRTNRAVAQESVASLDLRVQEAGSQRERLAKNLENLKARYQELKESTSSLEDEKSTQRQDDKQVGEKIEALQKLVDPAETELETLEQKQLDLQKEESILRQTMSIAEHGNAQARITLNKHLDALESLRRRIEDDFGLVEFDYAQEVSGPTPLPIMGMVEKLPVISEVSPDLEETLQRKRAQLRRMGAVNPDAQQEFKEVQQRYEFMTSQVNDLEKAETDIRQVIADLDTLMQQEFRKTFDAVSAEFRVIFSRLFGGGSARLILTDPEDMTNTGVDIEARLPGRRTQGLSLLSGGERSLTAAALVFSLLKTSPTPFCVLDEVDAMLDEANVGRYRELLKELSDNTQFIVITHNRNTVQVADVIYGVTMGKDSTSQVLSLRLDEVAAITNQE